MNAPEFYVGREGRHTFLDLAQADAAPAEVQAARDQLLRCSPELTLPYNARKRPRIITVAQHNGILRKLARA